MALEETTLSIEEKQEQDRLFDLACNNEVQLSDGLPQDIDAANDEARRVSEHNLATGYHEIVIDYDAIEAEHAAVNGFNYTDGDENNFAPDSDDFEPSDGGYSAGTEERSGPEMFKPGVVDTTTRNHFEIGFNHQDEYVPPDDLIDGIITRVSRNGIVGSSGSGKSFGIMEMAACVMTGKPFAGHDVLRRGGFGYFSYEAPGTVKARMHGLLNKYGEALHDVPWFPCPTPINLSNEDGWEALFDTVEAMHQRCWELFERPLVAIAVDTVHASQMVLKENDAGEWAGPLDWMKRISEHFKLAFLVCHHSGKSQDTPDGKTAEGSLWRGSGAAPAALDNILAVKMDKREGKVSRRWMFQEKSKDGETGYIADIETKVHVIGRKRNGKPATTLTLDFNRKTADDIKSERAQDAKAKAEAKAANRKRGEYELPLMQAIRIVAKEQCRETKLKAGGWHYEAHTYDVEAKFREIATCDPSNMKARFKSAVSALMKNDGLEHDETAVTYSLKVKEPVRLGAFAFAPSSSSLKAA
ncbi:AAA family ATPase [Pararhizobium sp.]|uniref:AAA family ATPase n=1 Tax=Pararhizobium sp. TaxID=1977563 RepID=UPI003D0D024F